jgi:hypothetical protein
MTVGFSGRTLLHEDREKELRTQSVGPSPCKHPVSYVVEAVEDGFQFFREDLKT